jgi:molybdopterin-biosynthesis enzyme MoeA-like protein
LKDNDVQSSRQASAIHEPLVAEEEEEEEVEEEEEEEEEEGEEDEDKRGHIVRLAALHNNPEHWRG